MTETADTWVSAAQIARLVTPVGREGQRFAPTRAPSEQPLLQGSFQFQELRSGLVVHSTHAHELHDQHSLWATEQGVRLVMVLGGQVDVSFGHQRLVLAPGPGRASAALVSLAQAEQLERRTRSGGYVRKLSISLTPKWLDEAGLHSAQQVQGFMQEHLSVHHWTPSQHALGLAEQCIQPSAYAPGLHMLHLESRAIELTLEAFKHLQRGTGDCPRPALKPADARRMAQLMDLLENEPLTTLSLDEMAQHVGSNATSLQQQFRTLHGCTVFEYVRQRRLQAAKQALQRDQLSVAQAAEVAGYGSAANFATAFKRRYGLSPKQVRSAH